MVRTYAEHRARFDAHDDGLYLGVPEPTYHGLDACCSSRLTLVMRSPAHAEHAVRNPSPSTTAQRLGSAVHRACLQPESFDGHYTVTSHSFRTNAYKALVAERGEDSVLSENDRDTALRVADAVHAHPLAGALLSNGGWPEATALWVADVELDVSGGDGTTESSGGTHALRCKGRVDYYDPASGVLADLKTTRDASEDAFSRSAWEYGYFRQLALYAHALERLGLEVNEVLVVAAEKEPPYGVAVYAVEDAALRAGWRQVEDLVGVYARCEATGVWPCYGEDAQPLTLPAWAWNRL